MSGLELTTVKLLDLLETERRTFSDDYLPFTQKELQAITKYSNLLAQDRTTIRRNIPKTRAHIILSDIWAHNSEIFVLCALATNPTSLGSLKSQDYLRTLLGWWNGVEHPKGLTEAMNHHPNVLPPKKTVASEVNTTRMESFYFVLYQQNNTDQS